MSRKEDFFHAPEKLKGSESKKADPPESGSTGSAHTQSWFKRVGLDGKEISGSFSETSKGQEGALTAGVPLQLSETDLRKIQKQMNESRAPVPVHGTGSFGQKNTAIIRFHVPEKHLFRDVKVPLDITANDLIMGLSAAYGLEIDLNNLEQCYLLCENPIAFLKGKQLLGEYGIRDGSVITCK